MSSRLKQVDPVTFFVRWRCMSGHERLEAGADWATDFGTDGGPDLKGPEQSRSSVV